MALVKSRSNSFRGTREEDQRDSVLLFSDIHKMPIRPSKSLTDLSWRAGRCLPDTIKVIPLRRPSRTKVKKEEKPQLEASEDPEEETRSES